MSKKSTACINRWDELYLLTGSGFRISEQITVREKVSVYTPRKTTMAIKKRPFEDVSHKNIEFSLLC